MESIPNHLKNCKILKTSCLLETTGPKRKKLYEKTFIVFKDVFFLCVCVCVRACMHACMRVCVLARVYVSVLIHFIKWMLKFISEVYKVQLENLYWDCKYSCWEMILEKKLFWCRYTSVVIIFRDFLILYEIFLLLLP